MNEGHKKILEDQAAFYKRGDAGCKFAEYVAKDPEGYDWVRKVFDEIDVEAMDAFISKSEQNTEISMISMLFPNVNTQAELEQMLDTVVENSRFMYLEPSTETEDFYLIHMRAKIHDKASWISGFAPLEFLPKTRQAIHTEIVFRVRERPDYPKSIEAEPPVGTLHIADLEIPEMGKAEFTQTVRESFANTKRVLGHSADALSAAKTTFIIPK